MIKKKNIIIICICLIFLLIVFFPYLKAEILTAKYGEEFWGLEQQTNMLSESYYHKVLSYSNEEAKVFYASNSGDLLTFKKDTDGIWKLFRWETVWSKSGSASGFMWPYYR